MEYEINQRRDTRFTWKTPPMRKGKTTGISQQRSHYLKSLGYTPAAAYKRIKSPRNSSKGIYRTAGGLRPPHPPCVCTRARPDGPASDSAALRQKPGYYPKVNLEQLQQRQGLKQKTNTSACFRLPFQKNSACKLLRMLN